MDSNQNISENKAEQKAKIRDRYRNSKTEGLEKIPAKPRPVLFDDDSDKRVAVYARVSTLATQQTSSFELQQKHYSDFVDRQNGWELIKIYSDEGISGTSLNHRDGFKDMINDCKKGGIDLIVVKSISRFSRNVVDGITIIDELRSLSPPVGVYFEMEGIYTLTNDNELSLTLLQTIAQEESRIKSVSMDASYEMRFSHGIFLTPPLLGYDRDEDGNLRINCEEALTVKLTFYMYLSGYSTADIAEKLTKLGRKGKKGSAEWTQSSVTSILHNERHCGAVLARKTWTPNYKTHKARKNRGDRNQYYDPDHHAPIISRDDFNAVQKMLANAKYGVKSFMPELCVIRGGEMDGYVAINPRWAAFTAEDYRRASAKREDDYE
jgi:Site-specific recombinases, DNA invertase Pin homologs